MKPRKARCTKGKHQKGCRRSRPLCRERRKEKPNQRRCWCSALHFPHRFGSSGCGKPEEVARAVWGEDPEEAAARAERAAIVDDGGGLAESALDRVEGVPF